MPTPGDGLAFLSRRVIPSDFRVPSSLLNLHRGGGSHPRWAGLEAAPNYANSSTRTLVTKGIVAAFDAQRGVGYVQHLEGSNLVPFAARNINGDAPNTGDVVNYTVIGGKAGVTAKNIRRVMP